MFGLFKSKPADAPALVEVRLGGRTDWREIVHMRDHSREILAILKEQGRPSDRDPDEIAASGPVALVREPGASGDLVAVVFAGRRVGYLSKRDAAKVAPGLAQLIPAGHVAVTGARIALHLDHHPERLKAGSQYLLESAVTEFSGVVTVATPDEWFPANHAPAGQTYRLHFEGAGSLVGTDAHQDHLRYLATAGPAPYFWATLSASATPRGRVEVDVLVDGVPIGKLGPTLTKEVGHLVVDRGNAGVAVVVYAHPTAGKTGLVAHLTPAR